ncbi:tRNA lysidine(34) synthetase TilS [Cytobacillus purgationiresistens]|uniref:tRNA(Ile)-lysidine synthase n=1 Tax=Cytobacillus purgationiresistens TaxID=863449 RepID=A0ABU0APG5_9BACI|nr:tRNA lysidine(34) synthetase TilS [Cytobacillus purgationiresistens]MDQ0273083.1 tRNA(Ile)-lysidine synthase [Cytobacillus purgationiresistens]
MIDSKVKSYLINKDVELKEKKIGVGVSGGPDSMALLHYLHRQKKQTPFHIVAIHVDHMFRGEESYEDALFVQRFCEERKIPFTMKRVNVTEYMERTGQSSQNAARICRYQFYEEVMEDKELDYLALGHHGDDQIETVLMRLTRGSTGSARAGIPFKRPFGKGEILRPFLCLSRKEIEDYCGEHQIEPRRDPSNEKGIYSRNRFRKKVLPFLRQENPQVHEHFQRFSEELRRDEAFLQELTADYMNRVMDKKQPGEIVLNIDSFSSVPMPLQRRGIQLILNYLYQEKPPSLSATHIENVFSLLTNPHPSGTLNFPNGLTIVRSYQKCYFHFSIKAPVHTYCFNLHGPGEIKLPYGGRITLEYTDKNEGDSCSDWLLLPSSLTLPLIIRTRKDGDRMTLRGIRGSKKLKDIFIDQKVPLHERKTWPVVTDGDGRILWLPGLKKYQETVQSHFDKIYILLKYIKQ